MFPELLTVVNSAARTLVYKFLCGHVFIPLEYIARGRIAGSNGNSMFNLLKNYRLSSKGFLSTFNVTVPLLLLTAAAIF